MNAKILFNVLSKDLENAMEISKLSPERILVGLMVKNFKTNEEAAEETLKYMSNGILTSVGLGAGDPAQWKRVVEVSAMTKPYHINQVFPGAGYTLGTMSQINKSPFIVNSLIEPSPTVGKVYISTGPVSKECREEVSCDMAAKMLADIGLMSVKFYPIDGNKRLDHVKAMVKAAVENGIEIFEPTGGIDINNVHEIVKACLDHGATTVIPHLYTSLIDKSTGKTKVEYMQALLNMTW